jgi:xanthine/uracil/vitamin C permease (AzgA family)
MILERLFRLHENNTNARTEVIAGITTFTTMAYIRSRHFLVAGERSV